MHTTGGPFVDYEKPIFLLICRKEKRKGEKCSREEWGEKSETFFSAPTFFFLSLKKKKGFSKQNFKNISLVRSKISKEILL